MSLEDYDEDWEINMPKRGYISDAEIAAKIGGNLIDAMCRMDGKKILLSEEGANGAWVDYDETLGLWRVSKGYLLHRGAVVILEQDRGTIVDFYYQK